MSEIFFFHYIIKLTINQIVLNGKFIDKMWLYFINNKQNECNAFY